MKISDIKIGDRARREVGDIEALAKSIQQVGLLHPAVVAIDGTLVSGFRRIEAYKLLGRDEIPHRVAENLDDARKLLQAERDENTERKSLSPSEAVALAEKLKPLERAEAEKRKRASRIKGKGNVAGEADITSIESGGGNLPPQEKGKSRDKVAASVGMSERSLKKAEAVLEAAKVEPEKYDALVEEMDTTGKVDRAYRKLKKLKASESGPETHEDGKMRSWKTGLKNIYHVIGELTDEGSPASILGAMCAEERQRGASELIGIADVFRGWAELLNDQHPEAARTPAGGPATIDSGACAVLPMDERTAPVNRQAIAEHVETEGPLVLAALDCGDPDEPEWFRKAKREMQMIKSRQQAKAMETGQA